MRVADLTTQLREQSIAYDDYAAGLDRVMAEVSAASYYGGARYQKALDALDAHHAGRDVRYEDLTATEDSISTLDQVIAFAEEFDSYVRLRIAILAQEDSSVQAATPSDSARHATNADALAAQAASNDDGQYESVFSQMFATELQAGSCQQPLSAG